MKIAKSSSRSRPSIVIGGGIAGLTVAWELASRGIEVVLVDRGRIATREPWGPATASSVGVLSAPKRGRSPLKRLQRSSHHAYPSFVARLRAESGMDPGFRVPGSMHLSETLPRDAVRSKQEAVYRDAGVESQWLTGDGLEELCPGLGSRFQAGLHLPCEAVIDPARLLGALRVACERKGVLIRESVGPALLISDAGRTTLRLASGETLRDATYVVAAGAWSGDVVAGLHSGRASVPSGTEDEPALPIRPIRGQALALQLDRHGGPNLRFRPRDMDRDYHVIVSRPGTFWVGSTVEDVGFDGRVTEAGSVELLRAAREVLGSVDVSSVIDRWAGLRPQARRPGGPLLGPLPWAEDVWLHCGHYRSGVLLSPLTARLLVEALLREDSPTVPSASHESIEATEIIEALRWS